MNFLFPVIALVVTIATTAFILHSRFSTSIQDVPNERSLHIRPVPRTGGIALIVGIFTAWSLQGGMLIWWLLVPLCGLFAVSILDDIYNLSVKKRFLAHAIAAALLISGCGIVIHDNWWMSPLVFLFAIWMTNLYNFMDGSDGLAGGMALFGFGTYGIAALLAQHEVLAVSSFCVSASALGFLLFNFHPARIFMGDAGSIPLGFLAAGLGVWGWQHGDWSVWFPLIVFSPFLIDTTVTLFRRSLRGVRITEAHREHYYQRAIQMGAGHRNVALFEYALMSIMGGIALSVRELDFPLIEFFACAAIYAACMLPVDVCWKNIEREC